jgi:hypothetical protein
MPGCSRRNFILALLVAAESIFQNNLFGGSPLIPMQYFDGKERRATSFVRLFLLRHVTVLQKYYSGQEWQAILSIQ